MIDLRLGDCLEILPTLASGSVDAVITDPPYGNGTNYTSYTDTQDNLISLIERMFPELQRVSKSIALTSGVKNQWLYPRPDWVIAWIAEGNTGSSSWGFSCWQPILVYGKDPFLSTGRGRRPDIIKYQANKNIDGPKEINGHPCSKPVGLMMKIIERVSPPGATILDPCMGSGTTGVACVQTGRNFIGIEIDENYFSIAKRRIEEAQAQMVMPL